MENEKRHDPAATFRADQAAAMEQHVTRDQIGWELATEQTRNHTDYTAALARRQDAMADLIKAAAGAITMATVVGVPWAASLAVRGIVGWFQ